MKKQKVYYSKYEICKLHNISLKSLNEILINNGILHYIIKTISYKGKKKITLCPKHPHKITNNLYPLVLKKSGSWSEGVYHFRYSSIKHLLP